MWRKMISLGAVLVFSAFLLAVGLWFPHTTRAANLCVAPGGAGGCYTAIQSAINAAADGDTVRVAQGTYLEAITITKSINLEGGWNSDFSVQDWDTYVSTIDAQRTNSVIFIPTGITATVEGFTITGGEPGFHRPWGGGIRIGGSGIGNAAFVAIRHNVITDNVVCSTGACTGEGGGISVSYANALIEYNTIISNVANAANVNGGRGGGISTGWRASVEIAHNTIMSNTAAYSTTGLWGGYGGGIYTYGSTNIHDNELAYNTAAIHGTGYGGGIYAGDSLYDNDIHDNTASIDGEGYGGGVYAWYAPHIDGNTISNNYASRDGSYGYGGGIYARYVSLTDNIITGNSARQGGGVYFTKYSDTTVQANIITGNQATGSGSRQDDGGGGMLIKNQDAEIIGNTITGNTTNYLGGGILSVTDGKNTIKGNIINNNTAIAGGGIAVYTTTTTTHIYAESNQIVDNFANSGGGVYLLGAVNVTLNRNMIADNAASGLGTGGAMYVGIDHDIPVTITNNIFAHNAISSIFSNIAGVYCRNGASRLLNNTFVDNSNKIALYLYNPDPASGIYAYEIWNNLFVGHSTAVEVNSGAAFVVKNGFWDNTTNIVGSTDIYSVTLDPLFVDRTGGDYHLTALSPMIDAASDSTSPAEDFDGDPRPMNAHADIGADEYARHVYLPLIFKAPSSGGGGGCGR